ncbi:MAG: hypothetical protein CFE28_00170 [Alphaproteobacteria bacterium PA2]|nr:MAG: hypothetical protein CFE28_00170 [Alphaproteobacteria bacterium PA2]
MTEPTPSPARSPALRRRGWWLAGGLALTAALAGGAAWQERQTIGASVLKSWLEDQGVEGDISFTRFGPGGLSGALRIGPKDRPDLTVDVAEVSYDLRGPWNGGALAADFKQVRLVRPVLRGEWRDGALRFGSLDPLIRKLLAQPRDPDRRVPDLVLENGRLTLATPAGNFEGSGSGEAKSGHLVRLDVRLAPTEARSAAMQARLKSAELHLVRREDRLVWAGDLYADSLKGEGLAAHGLELRLTGESPYPDLRTGRADGRANLVLTSGFQDLTTSGVTVRGISQTTKFEGDLLGQTASGHMQTRFSTGTLRSGGNLALDRLTGAFAGPARLTADGLTLTLGGGAETAGSISGRRFVLKAPGQSLKINIDKAMVAQGQGPFDLASEGAVAKINLDRYRLEGGRLTASGRLAARGSIGPIQDGAVDLKADLAVANGVVRVMARGCAPVTAKRIDMGANSISGLSAEVCPTRIEAGASGLKLAGDYRKVSGQAADLEVSITDGEGRIRASGPDLAFETTISRVKVSDLAASRRFQPVFATGQARGSDTALTGEFRVTDAYGRPLAEVGLRHAGGAGGVTVETGALVFAEGGLQPRDISPLASSLGSPVAGQVRFQGALDWKGESLTSRGNLDIAGLDFISAAGPVKGLKGQIALGSLLPLKAAPGQTLHVDSVASLAALTNAEVTFGLDHDALQVAATGFSLAQGRVVLEPFEIPLAANAPWSVVADLKGVQLSELVEASPFADRMDLTARVDGHIPLSFRKGTVQIAGGELHAIEPGRLSIRREALTQVQARPTSAAALVDPYSDFAFQALENLAFTQLDARVDSLADGRLGVRFHIKGEHSPPVSPEIRLTLRELLTQKIKRTLPLPKGVKVDLSLDTSVNLDQLLDDFDKYQTLRNSAAVQP